MPDSTDLKRTWRNSPWTVVVGFPVAVVILFVFIALPCAASRIAVSARAPNCRTNLHRIAEAKSAWAEAGHKPTNDIPTDADIFGPDKYLHKKLTCFSGGAYTLGSVAEKPRCSIPGHTI